MSACYGKAVSSWYTTIDTRHRKAGHRHDDAAAAETLFVSITEMVAAVLTEIPAIPAGAPPADLVR